MDTVRNVIVFDEKAELMAFVIRIWRKLAGEAMAERGFMTVALSGGKTPVDLYRAIGEKGKDLPWKKIDIFLADERFVPHTDDESNFGMIRKTLLEAVPIPKENIHAVETQISGADEAARRYEEELVKFFELKPRHFPRFDLIMLGLGEDGHVASLFPGSTLLYETTRLVRGIPIGKGLPDRVTFTMPLINNARRIVFLVEGLHKATILRKVVEERDQTLPATRVKAMNGDLFFLADRDAAGQLAKDTYVKGVL